MNPTRRVVARIPMNQIWNAHGSVTSAKQRTLGGIEIADLLRQGLVRFVVADCGNPLEWIPPAQCYDFWKSEAKPRIVETQTFDQAEFPGAYCYVASEWADGQPAPIVLLEKYH